MSPQRFAKVAVMCGTVVLAAWCGGRLGVGPALVQTTAAVPIEQPKAASLIAEAERADLQRPIAIGEATTASVEARAISADAPTISADLTAVNTDAALAAEPETAMATGSTAAKDESKLIVEAALPDSSSISATEPQLVQVASADP